MGWIVRGAEGDNVAAVQGLLWQAGLYTGELDGVYGRKTEQAVKDWQSEVGALPDGMWGPRTQDNSVKFLGRLNSAEALDAGKHAIVPYIPREL